VQTFSVAGKKRGAPLTLENYAHSLGTPITLQAGEFLYVAIEMRYQYSSGYRNCLHTCPTQNSIDIAFISDRVSPPYAWQSLWWLGLSQTGYDVWMRGK
jgi:hypothetical protein